ncbi:hypothetical protein BDR26DRAFT_848859, partial [Obelidium mucronatum]
MDPFNTTTLCRRIRQIRAKINSVAQTSASSFSETLLAKTGSDAPLFKQMGALTALATKTIVSSAETARRSFASEGVVSSKLFTKSESSDDGRKRCQVALHHMIQLLVALPKAIRFPVLYYNLIEEWITHDLLYPHIWKLLDSFWRCPTLTRDETAYDWAFSVAKKINKMREFCTLVSEKYTQEIRKTSNVEVCRISRLAFREFWKRIRTSHHNMLPLMTLIGLQKDTGDLISVLHTYESSFQESPSPASTSDSELQSDLPSSPQNQRHQSRSDSLLREFESIFLNKYLATVLNSLESAKSQEILEEWTFSHSSPILEALLHHLQQQKNAVFWLPRKPIPFNLEKPNRNGDIPFLDLYVLAALFGVSIAIKRRISLSLVPRFDALDTIIETLSRVVVSNSTALLQIESEFSQLKLEKIILIVKDLMAVGTVESLFLGRRVLQAVMIATENGKKEEDLALDVAVDDDNQDFEFKERIANLLENLEESLYDCEGQSLNIRHEPLLDDWLLTTPALSKVNVPAMYSTTSTPNGRVKRNSKLRFQNIESEPKSNPTSSADPSSESHFEDSSSNDENEETIKSLGARRLQNCNISSNQSSHEEETDGSEGASIFNESDSDSLPQKRTMRSGSRVLTAQKLSNVALRGTNRRKRKMFKQTLEEWDGNKRDGRSWECESVSSARNGLIQRKSSRLQNCEAQAVRSSTRIAPTKLRCSSQSDNDTSGSDFSSKSNQKSSRSVEFSDEIVEEDSECNLSLNAKDYSEDEIQLPNHQSTALKPHLQYQRLNNKEGFSTSGAQQSSCRGSAHIIRKRGHHISCSEEEVENPISPPLRTTRSRIPGTLHIAPEPWPVAKKKRVFLDESENGHKKGGRGQMRKSR